MQMGVSLKKEKRIQEIDSSQDRDSNIMKALEECVAGTDRKRVEQTLEYL